MCLERVLWHGDAKETDELGQMGPPIRSVTDRPVGRAERGKVGRPWVGTGMEAAGDATEWAALGSLRKHCFIPHVPHCSRNLMRGPAVGAQRVVRASIPRAVASARSAAPSSFDAPFIRRDFDHASEGSIPGGICAPRVRHLQQLAARHQYAWLQRFASMVRALQPIL